MARKCKKRCVQQEPICKRYGPLFLSSEETVNMSVDEYETIRLIDFEKKTQEEAAVLIGVGRTTVQAIYDSARSKIADSLVNKKELLISGGEYFIDNEKYLECHCQKVIKENLNMIIAATYENGQIFQHFGHTQEFKVYEIEDNKIVRSEIVSSNGAGHSALAKVLENLHIDTLICGGIGEGAINSLTQLGIQIVYGAEGDVDEIVNSFIKGEIEFENGQCDCGHGDHECHCGEHDHEDHECHCGEHEHHHHGEHECQCGEHDHEDHECHCGHHHN